MMDFWWATWSLSAISSLSMSPAGGAAAARGVGEGRVRGHRRMAVPCQRPLPILVRRRVHDELGQFRYRVQAPSRVPLAAAAARPSHGDNCGHAAGRSELHGVGSAYGGHVLDRMAGPPSLVV